MTREQIEAHIGRLESIALTNWASPLDREAVDFAIARLRADLDAMPVGETRRVHIVVTRSVGDRPYAHVWNTPDEAHEDAEGRGGNALACPAAMAVFNGNWNSTCKLRLR